MSEQLTIKNLYNHMEETIAKDIFEGATYPLNESNYHLRMKPYV